MDPLESIVAAIEAAAPSWTVDVGYGSDIIEWVQAERYVPRSILVSVGPETAKGYREGGKAKDFIARFTVYGRVGLAVKDDWREIRSDWRVIRAALNGLAVVDDEGKLRHVMIAEIVYDGAAGFAEPQLTLEVH